MTKSSKLFIFVMAILGIFLFSGTVFSGSKVLMMATTTSTDNTGLLDYLAPEFKKDTSIELRWVAVGTGKALELGKNCDVDILLVHAPSAEKKFIKKGYGTKRTQVMYNDFVIVGPEEDPAGIKGKDPVSALKLIWVKKATFVSRGDNSGTNRKEIGLWKKAGLEPFKEKSKWYRETGQGMLSTLRIASELRGYTLTDRGTYIKFSANHRGNPPLKIVVEGYRDLFNQYSVIIVNPERCPRVKYGLAIEFVRWITSGKVQKMIGDFKLLGKKLFVPNARSISN